jgi:hypothetical protein
LEVKRVLSVQAFLQFFPIHFYYFGAVALVCKKEKVLNRKKVLHLRRGRNDKHKSFRMRTIIICDSGIMGKSSANAGRNGIVKKWAQQ